MNDTIHLDTLAARRARSAFASNQLALARTQPRLRIDRNVAIHEWVFARDSSLTALVEPNRWLADCSIPRRAAIEMLSTMNVTGPVGCILCPDHAATLRVALDRLAPSQALIAIVPLDRALDLMLHCEDFAADFDAHRLWFASGAEWATDLRALFVDQPGLSLPTQFVKLPTAVGTIVDPIIKRAQQLFSKVVTDRASDMGRTKASPRHPSGRLCVVAPSNFRLWEDAGHLLSSLFDDAEADSYLKLNPDDPATSSPLAFASAAHQCGALVVANNFRADLPGVIADDLPWITFATTPRIAPFTSAGNNDHLLTIDPAAAHTAGWPTDRVTVVAPVNRVSYDYSGAENGGAENRRAVNRVRYDFLGVAIDTLPLDVPGELQEYSSHCVLWESIRGELILDPFALKHDVHTYLTDRAQKLSIAEAQLDRARFIAQLILPAYHQGLARTLIAAGLPVQLHGSGWDRLPEFAKHAHGRIRTRGQFDQLLDQPIALVHVWPSLAPHLIDFAGAPVLRRTGNRREGFVAEGRRVLSEGKIGAPNHAPFLTSSLIRQFLAHR